MTKRITIAILISLFCVAFPNWVLSLFPTPCGGYGICMIVFYPTIFLLGLISGLAYFKFSNKIKFGKWLLVVIILVLNILLIAYFYPKGEFSPFYQIPEARKVAGIYEQLKPIDIFDATEKRNFNLITALYHKFNLPKETYTVSYYLLDTTGSFDTTIKTFNYFIKDNQVFTDDASIHFALDLTEESLTFTDTVQPTTIYFKVGYPDFGKYKTDFDNRSEDLTGTTGLVKDIGNLRVTASKNSPKFDYKFERLFEKYLDGLK